MTQHSTFDFRKSDVAYERMFAKTRADETYFEQWLALQDKLVADGDERAYHAAHTRILMEAKSREQQARIARRKGR